MKKFLTLLVIFLTALFIANATAFAEMVKGETREIFSLNHQVPMVVKTLKGDDLSKVHKTNITTILYGEDEKGFQCDNSKKPKVNLVILNDCDAVAFYNAMDMANTTTSRKKEGPLYQMEIIPFENLQPPAHILEKLNKIDITDPTMLIIYSGKKIVPGGIWKKYILTVLFAVI